MPREIVLGDALAPGLLLMFIVTLLLMWGIDKVATHFGIYRHVWHPSLFRLSFFTALFALLGLWFF